MLTVDRVSKSFGHGRVALAEVSLAVPGGQMVGIIGRSGAGKSTLLRIVNRLIEPDRGTVRFGNRDVTALRGRRLREWRASCAMIFQQFNLAGRLDVLTNVLLGGVRRRSTFRTLLKSFTREERREALEILDRLDLLPQALQRVETLSGGQQQRVAIARALFQRPSLLLADEPVSSLDPRSAAAVMDILAGIHATEGITIICNLHSLEIARKYCRRVAALAAGRLVFDGATTDLTQDTLTLIYDGGPRPEAEPARAAP